MAARTTRTSLNENWREKIQTSMLVNRLQNHADDPEKHKLLPTQLKAIEILLRKTIPDLKAIEHSGDVTVQVTKIVEELVKPQ